MKPNELICQKPTTGRHAESKSEVNNLEILHADLEIKVKHTKKITF